jgi:hypothetical protein
MPPQGHHKIAQFIYLYDDIPTYDIVDLHFWLALSGSEHFYIFVYFLITSTYLAS